MTTNDLAHDRARSRRRIEPSVGVAVAVVIVYMVVVNGIQVSSGISYKDWFDTGPNAVRTAVIPLLVGNVLLLAFVVWARWDIFWRDPERLPMSGLARAILGIFVAVVVLRLAWLQWADVPGDLLLAILATGVLVGLAEELVFRGVVLRCLRTHRRPESSAALWTAVGFGLFHLPNIFMGTGLGGLSQILLAGISGYALYLFRRWQGVIWVAMVAHGSWDIAAFLAGNYASTASQAVGLTLNLVLAVVTLVALIVSLRRDQGFTVTPQGIEQLSP